MPNKVFHANGLNTEIYVKVLKLSELIAVIKNDMNGKKKKTETDT